MESNHEVIDKSLLKLATIQITNYCKGCEFLCPNEHNPHSAKIMSIDKFKIILDTIKNDGIQFIKFNHYGDIFSMEKSVLSKYMFEIKARKMKCVVFIPPYRGILEVTSQNVWLHSDFVARIIVSFGTGRDTSRIKEATLSSLHYKICLDFVGRRKTMLDEFKELYLILRKIPRVKSLGNIVILAPQFPFNTELTKQFIKHKKNCSEFITSVDILGNITHGCPYGKDYLECDHEFVIFQAKNYDIHLFFNFINYFWRFILKTLKLVNSTFKIIRKES